MKWGLSLIIIGCCFYVGYGISSYYKKREKLFVELGIFCGKLKNDISFSSKLIEQILQEAMAIFKSPLNDILQKYLMIIKNGQLTDFENINKKINSIYLKSGEIDIIVQFLAQIGKSDCDSENATISSFEQIFLGFKDECFFEAKKYSSMYIKLSLLIGLFICIILI